jgi:hypothetical protein
MPEQQDPLECYYSANGAAWASALLNETEFTQYETLLPYAYGQTLKYRFRTASSYEGEGYAFLNPAKLDSNTFPPALNQMALIGEDPVGDSVSVYNPSLDLTTSYFGCTDTKFFAAMGNSSGTFPTLVSLVSYNAYMVLLINPESVSDTTAYAMIYTFNIPGIISSGLYKVGMAGDIPSFERIGNIQSQVSGSKLYLACNISDLIASPEFGAWPNTSHMLLSTAVTMNVSIPYGSTTPTFGFGDYATFGSLLFEFYSINAASNALPVISNVSVSNSPAGQTITFDYNDANQDFPLVSELYLNNGGIFQLTNTEFDFSDTVNFTAFIPALNGWSSGEIRISDNGMDYVNLTIYSTAIGVDASAPVALSCSLPNPVSPRGNAIPIRLSGMQKAPTQISVYNLKGQKIGNIFDFYASSSDQVLNWTGTVNGKTLSSGVYYLRVTQLNNSYNKRITVIR